MPTLARRNDVKRPIAKRNCLRSPFNVCYRIDLGFSIQSFGLLQQRTRRIECGNGAASLRKAARDRSRPRSQVEYPVARVNEASRKYTLEKLIWESRTVPAVILGRFAEINFCSARHF